MAANVGRPNNSGAPAAVAPSAGLSWQRRAFGAAKPFIPIGAVFLSGSVLFALIEGRSWVDGLYFAAAIVTTIGYGDIVPTAQASKIFFIVYAFAGFLSLGWTLRSTDGAVRRQLVAAVLRVGERSVNYGSGRWSNRIVLTDEKKDVVVGVFLVSVTAVIISFVFALVEGWSFGDGIVFGLSTVTSIGYGTYAPTTTFGKLLAVPACFLSLFVTANAVGAVQRMLTEEFDETRFLRRSKWFFTKRVVLTSFFLGLYWLGSGLIFSISDHWSLLTGCYFAATSLSTIGYGNLAPKSTFLTSIFMIFGFIGVGYFIALIGAIATVRNSEERDLAATLERTYVRKARSYGSAPSHTAAAGSLSEGQHVPLASTPAVVGERTVRRDVVVLLVTIAIAFATLAIFVGLIESWSVVDSLYFSAETLTTIGLGDKVPLVGLGRLVVIFYSFGALVWIAYALTVIQAMSVNAAYASLVAEQQEAAASGRPLMDLNEEGGASQSWPSAIRSAPVIGRVGKTPSGRRSSDDNRRVRFAAEEVVLGPAGSSEDGNDLSNDLGDDRSGDDDDGSSALLASA